MSKDNGFDQKVNHVGQILGWISKPPQNNKLAKKAPTLYFFCSIDKLWSRDLPCKISAKFAKIDGFIAIFLRKISRIIVKLVSILN